VRRRRAEPIGKILAELIEKLGIASKMSEQRAVIEWAEIVGEKVAAHTRAVRVDKGRLFVEVDSPVWSQELTFMKRKIMREINRRIGREAIEHVHFVLGGSKPHDPISNSGKDEEDGKG
jgi:predicted nucleic acid-binding Zn ribbon protein